MIFCQPTLHNGTAHPSRWVSGQYSIASYEYKASGHGFFPVPTYFVGYSGGARVTEDLPTLAAAKSAMALLEKPL